MHSHCICKFGGDDGLIALGEWLRQLVVIVLLAVFTDLLLPTKTMQKYVRVVLGLTIIAAMLQPVVPFFQKDWTQKVTQIAIDEFDAGQVGSSTGVAQAEANYKNTLETQTQTEADALIAGQLTTLIDTAAHCSVLSVSVDGVNASRGVVTVTVTLPLVDVSKVQQVQSIVSSNLHIPLQQVHVTAEGG